ncbi:hypothetical protein [Streptomyces sp. NPDC101150]|uniref:hypothetical protein n=1 Tax=Streptomyces sp. NPDC101150 TaxID=3366114 RepID=UPI0037F6B880
MATTETDEKVIAPPPIIGFSGPAAAGGMARAIGCSGACSSAPAGRSGTPSAAPPAAPRSPVAHEAQVTR